MNLDELKTALQDETNAEAFKGIIKEMGFEAPEDVQGLKVVNSNLKAEKMKVKTELDSLKKRLDEIDEDGYIAYKNKRDSSGDDSERLKREYAKIQKDYSEVLKKSEQLESEYNNTLRDNVLSEALESAGFKTHKTILKQALQAKAKVIQEDGKRLLLIDDGDGLGLPAQEYIKKFAESEQGKQYLDKPVNGGSGSTGFSGTGSGKTMKLQAFKQLSPQERSSFMKDGGKLTE